MWPAINSQRTRTRRFTYTPARRLPGFSGEPFVAYYHLLAWPLLQSRFVLCNPVLSKVCRIINAPIKRRPVSSLKRQSWCPIWTPQQPLPPPLPSPPSFAMHSPPFANIFAAFALALASSSGASPRSHVHKAGSRSKLTYAFPDAIIISQSSQGWPSATRKSFPLFFP